MSQLKTAAPNQWCPGCGNFGILKSVQTVLEDLRSEGFPLEKIVMVSGIGNHAKIVDYLHINSFYSIHGRTVPAAEAIRMSDPETKVICFAGDGDAYAEGLDHLIFAAKRNIDITVLIHDNRAYALATGQFTPTSPQNYRASTTPYGARETPLNPLELMLASGATFIARGYPVRSQHFEKLLREAIMHKGFSFIDVLQVCVTYNNLYDLYNQNVSEVEAADPTSFDEALHTIKSWDYNSEGTIAIGKFFEVNRPGYEANYADFTRAKQDRTTKLQKIYENFI
jgi:2-oxoglutarate/2-oxoacid ferredoxin oxidoreductase subunit beta